MKPHLICGDYWTRKCAPCEGGTVKDATRLDIMISDNNGRSLRRTRGEIHQVLYAC
jgi:hypothetical protein